MSLQEFVDAFSDFAENVTANSWVLRDLGLDGDELDWHFRYVTKVHKWTLHWERDMSGFLPHIAGFWADKSNFPDLKLRELYAFSMPTAQYD